jgi:hypothetical protein
MFVHHRDGMNRPRLRILCTILLTLIGIVYTAFMRQFGIALSGNGMGARLFQFLVSGPEGLCLLIWPLLFAFLPWTRYPKIALTVVSLSFLPLLWAAILLTGEGFEDDAVKNIWKQARPVIYIFSALFVFPTLLGLSRSARPVIVTLKAKPTTS